MMVLGFSEKTMVVKDEGLACVRFYEFGGGERG